MIEISNEKLIEICESRINKLKESIANAEDWKHIDRNFYSETVFIAELAVNRLERFLIRAKWNRNRCLLLDKEEVDLLRKMCGSFYF